MRLVKMLLLLSLSLYCTATYADKKDKGSKKMKAHKKEQVKKKKPMLTETHWYLSEVNNVNAGDMAGAKEAYLFMSKGKLTGSTGCNSISGKYDEDRNVRIRFDAITTRMACPDRMQTENVMLNVLSQATTYKINGEHLLLYNDNVLLAVFDALL